jgi:hypothetical protein
MPVSRGGFAASSAQDRTRNLNKALAGPIGLPTWQACIPFYMHFQRSAGNGHDCGGANLMSFLRGD